MEQSGKVYLIGAGPGDWKLLTLKAVECLQAAEVVVYDRLVGGGVLNFVNPRAELIDVGKKPDCHPVRQEAINQILIEQARAGKTVARLKGGDPFLFGRGGEEAAALAARGIAFEIVPGISSALAVPAYAGIPVTHRDYCASVHIITGHERPDHQGNRVDFAQLAALDGTLVFLMGVQNLATIARNLLNHGKDPATPAAVIERGATTGQRAVTGSLAEIADRAETAHIRAPAVVVVGKVVDLREQLDWFKPGGPLQGKKLLVTRARDQAADLVRQIEALGGTALEFPVIQIVPPDETALFRFDQVLRQIQDFTWLVFTSVPGVQAFWSRLQHHRIDIRNLAGLKIAAIGAVTQGKLAEIGLQVDFLPDCYHSEELLTGLLQITGPSDRVLLVRGDLASDVLPSGLQKAGISLTEVIAYRTQREQQLPGELGQALEAGAIDYLLFTSPSTVRHCFALLHWDAPRAMKAKIACIGPVTADAVTQSGWPVTLVATVHTTEGLLQQILKYEEETHDA
jgi:uroporphyrinogen III methyltransferase/synthase